eukprot:Gb_28352 [translate_table: standard]
MDGYANEMSENSAYIPAFLADYDDDYRVECDDTFEGMIFMSKRQTKKECFDRQLFGLPISQASLVKQVKPGMKLFLFEYERRQLYGVFEATCSGALNIEHDAFKSSGGSFPAQVRFRTVWDCHPLSENVFKDAISENYYTFNKFHFYLRQEQVLIQVLYLGFAVILRLWSNNIELFSSVVQVLQLICLFSSRKMDSQFLESIDMCEHLDRPKDRPRSGSRLGRFVGQMENDTLDSHDLRRRIDIQRQTANLLQEICHGELCNAGHHVVDNDHLEMNPANHKCSNNFPTTKSVFTNIQEDNIVIHRRDGYPRHSVCDLSDADKSLVLHSLPTGSGGGHLLDSDHQASYMRGCECFGDNWRDALVSKDSVFTGTNTREEMCNTNIGEFYVHSNSQHLDSLYLHENGGSCSSLAFNPVPKTLPMPVDEISWLDGCQQLDQDLINRLTLTGSIGGCSEHMDNFQDDMPLHKTGQPGYTFMQPGHPSSGMPSRRSDNCTQKRSVFTRLSRAPEINISHEKDHDDLLRDNFVAKLHLQKSTKNFVRSVSNETKILEQPDESVQYMEDMDGQNIDNRIIINFKRRSQTCKVVRESNLQPEGQTNLSDGESGSHKQKRRKLVRPQFGKPNLLKLNAVPSPLPVSAEKCPAESKCPVQLDSVGSINSISNRNMSGNASSPTITSQEIPLVIAVNSVENKDSTALDLRQEQENGVKNKDSPALDSRQEPESMLSIHSVSVSKRNITGHVGCPSIQTADGKTVESDEDQDSATFDTRQGLASGYEKECSSHVDLTSIKIKNNVDVINQRDFGNEDATAQANLPATVEVLR